MKITFNSAMGAAISHEMLLMKKLELVQLRKQIQDLATFLPDEILKLRHGDMDVLHNFVGVLLYVYISGFTQLSEKYNKVGKGGIYRLTATLDAYIGAIVEVLSYYGGDVLKFTGNSFLSLWKVKPEDSLFEILHEVVLCALVIQQTLGHFETECVNIFLSPKMIITCGNLTFTVIGGTSYKDFIIVGEAVNEVQGVFSDCMSGEVVISYCAWAHMLQERYEVTPGRHGHIKLWKILYMPNEEDKQSSDDQRQMIANKLCTLHINHRHILHAKPEFDSTITASKITEEFVRTLQPRPAIKIAPKYWHIDDLRPFIIETVQHQINESQPVEYLTELRVVTVQSVHIIPTNYETLALISMVRLAYTIISEIVHQVSGMVNKISLFNKDVCLLISHGLGGIKHEMQSQNALKTSYKIQEAVSELKGVTSVAVSVTHGFVYCGAVGHPMRREFTLIGDAVNKANKMMCSFPAIVTCDHITFKQSKLSSFYFQMVDSGNSEEFEDFQVFQYNESCEKERPIDDETYRAIGRKAEWNYLRAIMFTPDKVGFYGICLHGEEKIGKSMLVRSLFREYKDSKAYDIVSVDLASISSMPYFSVSRLYRQIYDKKAEIHESSSMGLIKNLPRDLYDPADLAYNKSEDVATVKYKILKTFRDIIRFNSKPTIVFVDNMQFIDVQSWEIIEIVMNDQQMRLIAAGLLNSTSSWDLKWRISLSEEVTLFELAPIESKYIAAVACQFLNAAGISKMLLRFLRRSCDGRPGYVQSCLLSLANNEYIELTIIENLDDVQDVVFPDPKLLGSKRNTKISRIIGLSEKYLSKREQITLDAISMDLFDSFTPYQQLVIKTGAVLGDIFTRNLLKVVLKFPSEVTLATIIQKLFNEEVFDCGSRYMYAHGIDTNKVCCRCYFDETIPTDYVDLPKFAFCKIIHFKNRNIRKMAYNLLPDNHRKDLHLRCTDILEEMNQQCPFCLRDPSLNSISFRKFKEVISYCKNPHEKYGQRIHVKQDKPIDAKVVIRRALRHAGPNAEATRKSHVACRVIWDPLKCQCFEIMSTTYKDLIYHSSRGEHIYKLIFFSLYNGILLNLMGDYEKARTQLQIAREMILADGNKFNGRVNHNFRKLHAARIDMALATSYVRLRQLNPARSHLACAMRQFNIPLLAWSNKFCNKFLTRSSLVQLRRVQHSRHGGSVFQHDMSECLMLCSQLFIMEGNWQLAKLTANYSLFIMKNICTEIPIVFDVYSNAVDIYRHFNDSGTCEKLHRCIIQEIQTKVTFNRSVSLIYMCTLMVARFETICASGNIVAAIRMGYRLIDLNYRVYAKHEQLQILNWMVVLLLYNFRLKDYVDLCKLTHENVYLFQMDNMHVLRYYTMCLGLYLHSGFVIEPLSIILEFVTTHFEEGLENLNPLEIRCCCYVHIHFLRLGKFEEAAGWFIDQAIKSFTGKLNDSHVKLLIFIIEANLLKYLHARRTDHSDAEIYLRNVEELMQLLDRYTKTVFQVFRPTFLLHKAWLLKVKKHHFQSGWLIKEAEKLSLKQDNKFCYCLAKQMTNHWSGGFTFDYGSKPAVDFNAAKDFSVDQWAQIMHAFPVE